MDAAALADMLLACRPLPKRQLHKVRGDISAERMAALRSELLQSAPLPPDVYFDGRRYVSMDGDTYDEHPATEAAISELLASMNDEVDKANAKAEAAAREAEAEAAAYRARL